MQRLLMASIMMIGLTGCAGRIAYTPPAVQPPSMDNKTVARSFDRVWKDSTDALARGPWVIESQDRNTGLIVLRFAGNPEKYLDCGIVDSSVSNPRPGAPFTREYRFPGASPQQTYEQIVYGNIYDVTRTVGLNGAINVLFERLGRQSTRASVNAQYEVTRTANISNTPTGRFYAPIKDSVSFSSHSQGTLPGPGRATQCVATGQLEREVLAAIR